MGWITDNSTAYSTRATARQARKQTRLMEQMLAQQQAQPTSYAPAGWYPCAGDPIGSIRYWDGHQWTQGFKP